MVNIFSIYWPKMVAMFFFNLSLFKKKKFQYIDLIIVKLRNLTKNSILTNLDFHGRLSKFNIFRANSLIPWTMVQIREYSTAVTKNIPYFEGRPLRSKLLRNSFLVILWSLTILRTIWWNLSSYYFLIDEKKHCRFVCLQMTNFTIQKPRKFPI